jgi:hypothetical protein
VCSGIEEDYNYFSKKLENFCRGNSGIENFCIEGKVREGT